MTAFTAALSSAFKQRDALITAEHLLFSARATRFIDTSQAKCHISLKDKPGSVYVARMRTYLYTRTHNYLTYQ